MRAVAGYVLLDDLAVRRGWDRVECRVGSYAVEVRHDRDHADKPYVMSVKYHYEHQGGRRKGTGEAVGA